MQNVKLYKIRNNKLEIAVTYTLTEKNELIMKYDAVCDQDTYINSTNHSYFNLSGHDHGCIDADHEFCIYADAYLPVDSGLIPTGEIAAIEGNKFDLRKLALLPIEDEASGKREDYDHCLVLGGEYGPMRKAATVYSTTTGIQMDVKTDLPGIPIL